MYFRKIKFGNTALVLLALYILGYTHLLGGPYGVARFFFVLILVGALVFWLTIFSIAGFTRRIYKKQIRNFNRSSGNAKGGEEEKIKVDAKIIE